MLDLARAPGAPLYPLPDGHCRSRRGAVRRLPCRTRRSSRRAAPAQEGLMNFHLGRLIDHVHTRRRRPRGQQAVLSRRAAIARPRSFGRRRRLFLRRRAVRQRSRAGTGIARAHRVPGARPRNGAALPRGRPRWRAAATMARRASGITTPATTRRSCSIPTATTSRPSITGPRAALGALGRHHAGRE